MASNTDKTIVLITGANTGIGYHTAEALAASKTPYHIIITARDPVKGEAALSKLHSENPNTSSTFSFLKLDVTKAETITAAAESVEKEFGRLDVLINNAGLISKEETLISRLRDTFEANTFGPAVVTEAFTPLLLKSKNARLVFVTSSLGSITEKLDSVNWSSPLPALEYRMSKTALNMLAAYHHVHFGGKVKVWTYCPGYVVTDLSRTGQQGIEERKKRGAGDPKDSAAGILALVEGKRDSEVGGYVNKDGKIEW